MYPRIRSIRPLPGFHPFNRSSNALDVAVAVEVAVTTAVAVAVGVLANDDPTERKMILEHLTKHSPAEVLAQAKTFFARRNPLYAAFLEKEGPTFASFRGQGGEELVIGVALAEGGTMVRASTYLFDMQAQRFFATLPPVANPTQAGT